MKNGKAVLPTSCPVTRLGGAACWKSPVNLSGLLSDLASSFTRVLGIKIKEVAGQ